MALQWDPKAETILKKDDPAPYSGVLVPDINYQNYKSLELYSLSAADLGPKIVCPEESSDLGTKVFIGVVAFLVGGLVFHH